MLTLDTLSIYIISFSFNNTTSDFWKFPLGDCDPSCSNGVTSDYEFLEEKENQILYYTKTLDFETVNNNFMFYKIIVKDY